MRIVKKNACKEPTETAIRSLQNAPPLESVIPLGEFPNKIYNNYYLRKNVLCELPQRSQTMKYGINSLRFRGAMLWNTLNDDAKKIESVAAFKKEIKTWDRTSCLTEYFLYWSF